MYGINVKTPDIRNDVAPAGYRAGVGRGVTGFVTRSDIGPASAGIPGAVPGAGADGPVGYTPGAARGASGMGDTGSTPLMGAVPGAGIRPVAPGRRRAGNNDPANTDLSSFDSFAGFSSKLFNDTPYDDDDRKADAVYAAVDARMEERRKRYREERERDERIKTQLEKPRISDMFADLKEGLGAVTDDQWNAIPDIGDYSIKRKNRKLEASSLPVPDFILDSARTDNKMGTTAYAGGADTSVPGGGGASGGGAGAGAGADFAGLHASRGKVLRGELKKMSDSVSGQTVVDPRGLAADLDSQRDLSTTDIGDLKKARLLVSSMCKTNPTHGPGWIAAARVEEQAHKLAQARKIIRQGCERCPEDEDVWLEAARLATPAQVKAVLASAIKQIPKSVKLWMEAADKEADATTKKLVLRRALEFIPNSVTLWKAAVELEELADARDMLHRAVKCVPHSVDLWLALARLETYKKARSVLNDARKAVPTDPSIWITAAKLEEAQGNAKNVGKVITRAVKSMSNQRVHIDREAWLRHAEDAEAAGAPLTCAQIIYATIGNGVEDEDKKRTWLADADSLLRHGSVAAARAVFAHMLSVPTFARKASVWVRAAELEKGHGSAEELDALLKRATTACPDAEVLWLMAAKEKWVAGDVPASRGVLASAFAANPGSEDILLAAAKLEWENEEHDRARALLVRARSAAPSARVFMKAALLEREVGDTAAESAILTEALRTYTTAPKLWMMAGQLAEAQGSPDRARALYQRGLAACPSSPALWQLAVRLEERVNGFMKARSIVEFGRLKHPSPALWLESVRLERRAGNDKLAETNMAKALQDFPADPTLWAEFVAMAPRSGKRRRALDGLKKTDNHPLLMIQVASFMEKARNYDRARSWLNRAVSLDPDLGDAWVAFYCLELAHGTAEAAEAVLKRAVGATPRHGEFWASIAKATANRRKSTGDVLKLAAAQALAASHAAGKTAGASSVAMVKAEGGSGSGGES